MRENILEIKKIDEIEPGMGFSRNEEFVAIEALKAKFLKLQDKLSKMGEDIQDIENRLHNNN